MLPPNWPTNIKLIWSRTRVPVSACNFPFLYHEVLPTQKYWLLQVRTIKVGLILTLILKARFLNNSRSWVEILERRFVGDQVFLSSVLSCKMGFSRQSNFTNVKSWCWEEGFYSTTEHCNSLSNSCSVFCQVKLLKVTRLSLHHWKELFSFHVLFGGWEWWVWEPSDCPKTQIFDLEAIH